MRRKVLQDVANTLCPMLVGRIGEDLDILSELPDGTLLFDVLDGSVTHDRSGPVSLEIAGKLRAWVERRLASLRIPREVLRSVLVRAEFRTDRVPTHKKAIVLFDWRCESSVTTDQKTYSGRLETQQWHTRTRPQSLHSRVT